MRAVRLANPKRITISAERFDPDEVGSFILEGFLEVMNCTNPQELDEFPGFQFYTSCVPLGREGIGKYGPDGIPRTSDDGLGKGQMAELFAGLAEERRLLDEEEGSFVAPRTHPWTDDRVWFEGKAVDTGPPNTLCFTEKGVHNGFVNVLASSLIVGYFLVGEVYAMGKGMYLFIGGPLAHLIAPIKHGHLHFYALNFIQALVVAILFWASWERIFTVAHDFWACVETSVSVFVVLELDDRILPMLRQDVKRKCRRSLVKRGVTISEVEHRVGKERAERITITAGKEAALHGACMLYFFVVLGMAAFKSFVFLC